MFSILGTNLLKGKLGYCNIPGDNKAYGISITQVSIIMFSFHQSGRSAKLLVINGTWK